MNVIVPGLSTALRLTMNAFCHDNFFLTSRIFSLFFNGGNVALISLRLITHKPLFGQYFCLETKILESKQKPFIATKHGY